MASEASKSGFMTYGPGNESNNGIILALLLLFDSLGGKTLAKGTLYNYSLANVLGCILRGEEE